MVVVVVVLLLLLLYYYYLFYYYYYFYDFFTPAAAAATTTTATVTITPRSTSLPQASIFDRGSCGTLYSSLYPSVSSGAGVSPDCEGEGRLHHSCCWKPEPLLLRKTTRDK